MILFKTYKQAYGFIKARIFRPAKWRFNRLYNLINKQYLKEDLTKDYISKEVANKILYDPSIRCFRSMQTLDIKGIVPTLLSRRGNNGLTYYSTEDIKDELLRREIVCWKDYALYRKELYSTKKHRRKRARSESVKEKQWTLGKYNSKWTPKLKRIIQEIYNHQEIFDHENENYVSPIWLSTIGRKIHVKNLDSFDPIAELLKYKEQKKNLNKYNDGNQ